MLHGITRNDMVINTYEIQQIYVIFYWVSEYKPRCYQYVIIASYAHLRYRLADDDGTYAKFACYCYCIKITLIASHFFAFLLTLILCFYQCIHFSCVCDLEYSCIGLELWLTCLSIRRKHVLFITAKLSSKYSLLWTTRCCHFSVNHQVYSETKN